MKFYNMKQDYVQFNRSFDFRFKENVSTEVNDFGTINVSLGKYKTINTSLGVTYYWDKEGFFTLFR